MVRFARCVAVERLKIHGSTGLTVLFGTHNHTVAPSDGFSDRDGFNDAQLYVAIETSLDFVVPVERDWDWLMVGNGLCIRIDEQFQRRAFH